MKQLKEDQSAQQLASSIELLENIIQHQQQLLETYKQELNQISIEIAVLEAQKQKMMDDFQKAVNTLNEKISKLQALEYTA